MSKRHVLVLVIVALVCVPSIFAAQPLPVLPSDSQQVRPADWLPVIDKVFDYLLKVVTLVLAYLANNKAHEATKQGQENAREIRAGREEARRDVDVQTQFLAKINPPIAPVAVPPVIPPVLPQPVTPLTGPPFVGDARIERFQRLMDEMVTKGEKIKEQTKPDQAGL